MTTAISVLMRSLVHGNPKAPDFPPREKKPPLPRPLPAPCPPSHGGSRWGELVAKRGQKGEEGSVLGTANRLWIKCSIAGCDARRPWKTSAFPPGDRVEKGQGGLFPLAARRQAYPPCFPCSTDHTSARSLEPFGEHGASYHPATRGDRQASFWRRRRTAERSGDRQLFSRQSISCSAPFPRRFGPAPPV